MKNKDDIRKGMVSRRKFLGNTAALAAFSVVPAPYAFGNSAGKPVGITPDSNFGGVHIGAITYSWRSLPGGVDNIIRYCTETGISTIELMSNDVEESLGAPKNPMSLFLVPPPPPSPSNAATTTAQTAKRPQLSPDHDAAQAKYDNELKAWRLALPMSKYEEIRKKFDDAGISIHIIKFSPSRFSDEEIDYAFKAAKILGAKGVTDEIGVDSVKRLAPFAEKYGLYAIFHNHMQFATSGFSYDQFLSVSPAVMFNFDAGHFFGSTGLHPNTIIEKYHDRIINLHIKDKTSPKTDPPNSNQVWGQGQMPLADVLLLLKKEKWPIFCDIELEYEVKPWSDAVKEVKNCLNFARGILV